MNSKQGRVETARCELRRLLRARRDEYPLSQVERRGYRYLVKRLLPAVRIVAGNARTAAQRRAVAGGWSLIGDAFDIYLHAEELSLKAYRRALRLDARSDFDWWAYADMLERLGHVSAARAAYRRAATLGHDLDLREIETRLAGAREGRRRDGPLGLEERVGDLLARGRTHKALAILGARRTTEVRQLRARVYGARGDVAAVLSEYRRISASADSISMDAGDWFCFPDEIEETPEFWRIMQSLLGRFRFGWYQSSASVERLVPAPSESPWDSAASERAFNRFLNRRFHLEIRLRLAELTGDRAAAERLCRAHPTWKEARELRRSLSP